MATVRTSTFGHNVVGNARQALYSALEKTHPEFKSLPTPQELVEIFEVAIPEASVKILRQFEETFGDRKVNTSQRIYLYFNNEKDMITIVPPAYWKNIPIGHITHSENPCPAFEAFVTRFNARVTRIKEIEAAIKKISDVLKHPDVSTYRRLIEKWPELSCYIPQSVIAKDKYVATKREASPQLDLNFDDVNIAFVQAKILE